MRLIEEKPLRRALASLLGLSGKTRVEILAERYKDSLTAWSESPLVEEAAGAWADKLRSRSRALWVQWATKRYAEAMKRILKK